MRLTFATLACFALRICWASDNLNASAEVPFQFCDGFIWIKVIVPSQPGPLNFLLDSGAQVSVIGASAARRIGLTGGRPVRVTGVNGAATGFWPQKVDAWARGIQLPADYLRLDLSQLSQACTNGPVDGIVGAEFFRSRIVQIDFQKSLVRILASATAATGSQVLPLKVRSSGLLVPVQVDGSASEWVRLDTGCASALRWVTAGAPSGGCTKRFAVALTSSQVTVTKTRVTVGGVQFDAVPTDLQVRELFPGEKGLLGNGLLSRFQTVTIDAKRKEVILGPVW